MHLLQHKVFVHHLEDEGATYYFLQLYLYLSFSLAVTKCVYLVTKNNKS